MCDLVPRHASEYLHVVFVGTLLPRSPSVIASLVKYIVLRTRAFPSAIESYAEFSRSEVRVLTQHHY